MRGLSCLVLRLPSLDRGKTFLVAWLLCLVLGLNPNLYLWVFIIHATQLLLLSVGPELGTYANTSVPCNTSPNSYCQFVSSRCWIYDGHGA